jgi:uncharacterized damage-inducible protein DinB
MNMALLEMFRHKTWATLRLIEYCRGLSEDQLDATTPGTYGSIRETLHHLVDADEGYLSMLTREKFLSKEEGAAFVRVDPLPAGPLPLEELADRIRRMGPRWDALARDPDLSTPEVTTTDGFRVTAAVPMAQSIHHAGDHRSHVMSILGALGLETPGPNGLDLWGYAEAEGQMQELDETPPGR